MRLRPVDQRKMKVKVSIGSAMAIGLEKGKLAVEPTTLYLMLDGRCIADCKYCTQARNSRANKSFLSRIRWPIFDLDEAIDRLDINRKNQKRICIQTLKYPGMVEDLIYLVEKIKNKNIPISTCINPLPIEELKKLKDIGVERVGIGLDCASERIFKFLKKGAGSWEDYWKGLEESIGVFGNVSAHLIVGLEETDEEMVETIQLLKDMNVDTALFAFTPINGIINFPCPSIERYRAIQYCRYLITNDVMRMEDMIFDNKLMSVDEMDINWAKVFMTSGCPDCNRPFYNERVGGPLYNYPQELNEQEIKEARKQLRRYFDNQKYQK